jgi:hypothetical protein
VDTAAADAPELLTDVELAAAAPTTLVAEVEPVVPEEELAFATCAWAPMLKAEVIANARRVFFMMILIKERSSVLGDPGLPPTRIATPAGQHAGHQ